MCFSKICVCKFRKHSKDNVNSNNIYSSEFVRVLNRLMTFVYHCIWSYTWLQNERYEYLDLFRNCLEI